MSFVEVRLGSVPVVTEQGREVVARALFDKQVATYDFGEGVADLAWEDAEIRSFWRDQAETVVEALGIG